MLMAIDRRRRMPPDSTPALVSNIAHVRTVRSGQDSQVRTGQSGQSGQSGQVNAGQCRRKQEHKVCVTASQALGIT